MTLSAFINNQLSLENYAFTFDEIVEAYKDKAETSVNNDLKYATQKGDIVPLRHHFYLIIPPRYSRQGKLPLELYVDKLFSFLKRKYYVALYSAARFHGAAHQQIQKDYVIHSGSAFLDIKKNAIQIDFISTNKWNKDNIVSRKSDSGLFNISSPALTAADLLYHQSKIGGLSRVFTVIEELIEVINQEDIARLLDWYPHKSVLQRLGFILQEVEGETDKTACLYEHLNNLKFYPTLLSPKSKEKPGAVSNRWKVDVNIKLESDL